MNESTYILATGLLTDGATYTVGSVGYDRSIQALALRTIDGHAAGAGVSCQLTVGGAPATATFGLPVGQNSANIDLSQTPVTDPANSDLGLIIITANGERDLILTVTSQSNAVSLDPNWQVPTAGDLQSRIDAPTYAAFTSSILRGSQADPIPQILSDLTQTIRSLASRHSQLGPAGTIPTSFKTYFLGLCKQELFGRVAALRLFQDNIKAEVESANKRLDMLAKGQWPIEPPVAPLNPQPVAGASWGSDPAIDL